MLPGDSQTLFSKSPTKGQQEDRSWSIFEQETKQKLSSCITVSQGKRSACVQLITQSNHLFNYSSLLLPVLRETAGVKRERAAKEQYELTSINFKTHAWRVNASLTF